MMKRSRRAVFCVLATVMLACPGSRPPTDAELRSVYTNNRRSFEALESLVQARQNPSDRLEIIRSQVSDTAAEGSPEAILRDLHALALVMNPPGEPCELELDMHRWGLSFGGSTKGFCYARTPPQPLVDSLDEYWSDESRDSGRVFAPLSREWYLLLLTY